MMSIEGDLFEIQGGKIALDKATTPEVKKLAATLIKDHTKSLAEAVKVAKRLSNEVPDSPSPTQQWELQVVSTFSGKGFDRWYSDLEVKDHIQDIQEAKDEVEKGCNEDVRHLAKDDIPVLKKHLELAEAALEGGRKVAREPRPRPHPGGGQGHGSPCPPLGGSIAIRSPRSNRRSPSKETHTTRRSRSEFAQGETNRDSVSLPRHVDPRERE